MGRRVTRRAVLLGGAGLGVLAGAGVVTDVLPGGPALRRALGLTGPDGEVPDVPPAAAVTERVRSAARGRNVHLVVMGPTGDGVPVCLALHGRGGSALSFLHMSAPKFLTAAFRTGVPPFTLVAVDGGDTYFVDGALRMLVTELPNWLAERNLSEPTAALGISMGAFGALRYARERPLRGVAVAAPALFRSWQEAETRGVFRDERHWAANEPLRHPPRAPLGIWCGTEDPFVDAARDLAERTRARAGIGPGAHEDGYFLRVLPDMLRFVGSRLSGA